jgi:hypothetical protein
VTFNKNTLNSHLHNLYFILMLHVSAQSGHIQVYKLKCEKASWCIHISYDMLTNTGTCLQHMFLDYFHSTTYNASRVRYPFSVTDIVNDMSVQDYETLIVSTSDFMLIQKFSELPLTEFWCSLLRIFISVKICSVQTYPIFHNLSM